jgi:hypothetical protein
MAITAGPAFHSGLSPSSFFSPRAIMNASSIFFSRARRPSEAFFRVRAGMLLYRKARRSILPPSVSCDPIDLRAERLDVVIDLLSKLLRDIAVFRMQAKRMLWRRSPKSSGTAKAQGCEPSAGSPSDKPGCSES